jgi:hypothetical protein
MRFFKVNAALFGRSQAPQENICHEINYLQTVCAPVGSLAASLRLARTVFCGDSAALVGTDRGANPGQETRRS